MSATKAKDLHTSVKIVQALSTKLYEILLPLMLFLKWIVLKDGTMIIDALECKRIKDATCFETFRDKQVSFFPKNEIHLVH